MKKGILFLSILVFFSTLSAQRVGIGTATPDSSAILDLSSSQDGFLMPRMTMAQIGAIQDPAVGLQVYNTEDHCLYSFDGAEWRADCSFRSESSLPVSDLAWVDAPGMPGLHRENAVSFVLNGEAYVGAGTRTDGGGTGLMSDFYKLNPATNTWSPVASFPIPLSGAVAYVYKGEAYVATGDEFNVNSPSDKFYKYDPVGDSWASYSVMFPYRLSGAVSYVLDGVPHICGGIFPGGGANNEHFYYDSLANKYLFKADYPESSLVGAVAFVVNGIAYVGLGNGSNKFHAYDPGTNMWSGVADYPISGREGAVAFVLNGKGYVGTGSNQNDFYRYDPVTDTWSMAGEVPDLPGPGRSYGVSFLLDGDAYVGTGPLNSFYKTVFPGFVQGVNGLGEAAWISVDTDSTNEIQDLQDVLLVGNNAGNSRIQGLGYPSGTNDAATKGYVDNRSLFSVLSAGNFAGNIRIQDLGAPVAAQDAATKGYVDSDPDRDPTNELQDIGSVLGQGVNANDLPIINLGQVMIGGIPGPFAADFEVNEEIPDIRLTDSRAEAGGAANTKLGTISWYTRDVSAPNAYTQLGEIAMVTENDGAFPKSRMEFRMTPSLFPVFKIHALNNPVLDTLAVTVSNGTVTSTFGSSGWTTSSDARLKSHIAPLENSLEKILTLQGVRFNWKTNPNGRDQIGFIAQKAKDVFPEVVSMDGQGNYTMSYQNLVAPLVEAVKEQQAQIEELKKQNAQLEEAVKRIEAKLIGIDTGK